MLITSVASRFFAVPGHPAGHFYFMREKLNDSAVLMNPRVTRLIPFLAQSPKRPHVNGLRHGKAQVTAP